MHRGRRDAVRPEHLGRGQVLSGLDDHRLEHLFLHPGEARPELCVGGVLLPDDALERLLDGKARERCPGRDPE